MKNNRVELLTWVPEQDENIEINWPKVHKTIGLDQTNWLIRLPENQCQMFLEQQGNKCKLIAEFYDQQTLSTYHLMWAK
jgi:hypothetical protein